MEQRRCAVDGCALRYYAKGLCASHYQRQRLSAPDRPSCSEAECERVVYAQRLGLCRKHYMAVKLPGYHDEWRQRNKDKIRAQEAARRAADPERFRASCRRYRAKDPERRNAETREWRRQNPEIARDAARQSSAVRRAREAQVRTGRVSYRAILREHGMTCHLCGLGIADRSDLHFDHVVPIARGGQHIEENIRPSHALCNLRKGSTYRTD